jgi:hypothetical protein
MGFGPNLTIEAIAANENFCYFNAIFFISKSNFLNRTRWDKDIIIPTQPDYQLISASAQLIGGEFSHQRIICLWLRNQGSEQPS